MEAGLPGMWYNSGVIRHTRRFPMSQMQIARVDAIPLLFAWMQRMEIADQIDAHWTTHRVWAGLSYGQLTVLFLIVLIHERDHRLSALEPWVLAHHATLTAVTGWTIRREDVTDDRLGHLLGVIGKSPAQMTVLQQALGRHLVRAYALPTTIARVDTTTAWTRHTLGDGTKGRRIADAVVQRVRAQRDGQPGPEVWLILRRDPETGEQQAFLSNAPASVSPARLIAVSGMRWPIEQCFEVAKQELGMGDDEVRSWPGWHHHMTLVILAHFFLVRLQRRLNKSPGAEPGTDLPAAQRAPAVTAASA
jgi:hypothetical protein